MYYLILECENARRLRLHIIKLGLLEYFMLDAIHPMLQRRNKVFLFMLLIILFFL